jgi:acetyl esterase
MDFTVENGSVGSVPIRDYRPANGTGMAPFLWVHGGGFTSGGLDQKESDAPARDLAASGRWVRTIDYRLAPRTLPWGKQTLGEHPGRYPAAHHDVLAVAADLRAAAGRSIGMGGASAGANIAMGAALSLRDSGLPAPAALVMAYGTFHAALPDRPDVEADLRGPLTKWAFNPSMTHRMNLNYVGEESLLVPGYAFPGGADLRGIAPTLVINSKNDRLRQSGDTFADELRAAAVVVEQDVINSTHAYLNAPKSDGYTRGITLIADWLTRHD